MFFDLPASLQLYNVIDIKLASLRAEFEASGLSSKHSLGVFGLQEKPVWPFADEASTYQADEAKLNFIVDIPALGVCAMTLTLLSNNEPYSRPQDSGLPQSRTHTPGDHIILAYKEWPSLLATDLDIAKSLATNPRELEQAGLVERLSESRATTLIDALSGVSLRDTDIGKPLR